MLSLLPRRNRKHTSKARRQRNQLKRFEQLEQRLLLTTYSSVDVPQAIPDQTTINSTLSVPDAITIDDVDVTLDISHTNASDLDVFLVAPDGTRVELFTDVGGGGDNFSGTTLDDEAAGPITAGSAPFSGSYQPEGSLAALDGKDAQGTWTLEVTDDKRRKTGTLNSWLMDITPSGPPLPTLSIDDVALTEGDSGTTTFVFTVTRSGDTSGTSSVEYQTTDGTATAGEDYVAIPPTNLTFSSGETAKTVVVSVFGDKAVEFDETLYVDLSNGSNAVIADAQGIGNLLGDDAATTISYGDFSDSSQLNLMRHAAVSETNRLDLTTIKWGQAWFNQKQIVASAFETEFTFQIAGGGTGGLAFVVQNDGPFSIGPNMGYGGISGGIANSVAVEFDVYAHGSWTNDPDDNHVSVHTRGVNM